MRLAGEFKSALGAATAFDLIPVPGVGGVRVGVRGGEISCESSESDSML